MGRERVQLSAGQVSYEDTGSGPVLVFLHGLLVDGTLWRDVAGPLSDRFRCIVPDLPLGAHREAMAPDADLSPPGVARLVAEFLERLDLRDVTLVANDTGGAITQLLLADGTDRVTRVVLTNCDAFGRFLPAPFKPLQIAARVPGALNMTLQSMRIRPLRRLPIAFGWLTKRPVPRERLDAWLQPFLSDGAIRRDTVKLLRGIRSRDLLAASEKLPQVNIPVLIAWATEDKVFPVGDGRRLASTFPDARLEEIADSYAFVPEDQPGVLRELIAGFAAA